MRQLDDLDQWCLGNFQRLTTDEQELCLRQLDGWIPDEVLSEWWHKGFAESDPRFHFSSGMQIRNRLREVLPDHNLPGVEQPNGEIGRNWDDFYTGALHTLMRRKFDAPANG